MINNNKGFTIIELIVVVAILGILVFLAGPKLLGYVEKVDLMLKTVIDGCLFFV